MSYRAVLITFKLLLSVLWMGWQFYLVEHPFPPMLQQPLHVLCALMLVFLWIPLKGRSFVSGVANALLILACLASLWYFVTQEGRLSLRMETVDPVLSVDLIFFGIMMLLIFEAVRRVVGWALLGVILIFITYMFVGPWMPGWLRFSGFRLEEIAEFLTMTPNGLFGLTTITSVLYVFYFVVFGAFYNAIGGSRLFIDIGLSLVGGSTGGAAKAATLSSCLMGSISGSAVANVVATGVFTIPLMCGSGLSREKAAATEALASTGGQLMPPVMGVAAFVMAELLQIDYGRIAIAGLIPAIAFYFTIFMTSDLEARKTGRGTIRREDRIGAQPILPRLYLLLPPCILIGMLIAGYSATNAALFAIMACPPTALMRRASWLNVRQIRDALLEAGKQAATVAVPIAAIGIIVAIAVQTNLALKFSTRLMEISGGSLYSSMFFIIIGCLIMGMGLPTVAAYIIGAVLFVPALIKLGIFELSAHFFVMYYCVLSVVTPPVALASLTAAGIAEANYAKTGLEAFKLSLTGFLIPFAFAFDPALLAQGEWYVVLPACLSLLAACTAWTAALVGWLKAPLHLWERIGMGILAALIILAPTGTFLWSVGVGLLALMALWIVLSRKGSGVYP